MQISLAFWPSESCGTPSSQPLMTRPTLSVAGDSLSAQFGPCWGNTSERREGKGRTAKDGPDLGDERLAAVARRVKLGAVRLESADVVLSIAKGIVKSVS